jgi:circadian clock protein KaiC
MGLHFIFNGVRQGEPGVVATLQEHPTQLERIVQGFGWSIEEEGIEMMYRSPVDIYTDEWVYDLLTAVERTGARRVLIDSITDLQFALRDEVRFREYMYSLVQRFARQGVGLFMTSELPRSSTSGASPSSGSRTSRTTSCCSSTSATDPGFGAHSPS